MGDIAQGQQVSKKLPAKQLIPYVLLVVGAVAMAVSFFLPFASAKGDYAEYLKQYGDRVYTAEAGLHNKDVVGLVFCQVVIGQCGVSFPSEKAVGFSPVRNWPVIARVLLFHCIRA